MLCLLYTSREEDYDKLAARMDELGLDKTGYDWYLDLRKFGGVEHACLLYTSRCV